LNSWVEENVCAEQKSWELRLARTRSSLFFVSALNRASGGDRSPGCKNTKTKHARTYGVASLFERIDLLRLEG
jgi:hypothetical protein